MFAEGLLSALRVELLLQCVLQQTYNRCELAPFPVDVHADEWARGSHPNAPGIQVFLIQLVTCAELGSGGVGSENPFPPGQFDAQEFHAIERAAAVRANRLAGPVGDAGPLRCHTAFPAGDVQDAEAHTVRPVNGEDGLDGASDRAGPKGSVKFQPDHTRRLPRDLGTVVFWFVAIIGSHSWNLLVQKV